jgi:hypothetical protein
MRRLASGQTKLSKKMNVNEQFLGVRARDSFPSRLHFVATETLHGFVVCSRPKP